MAKLYFKGCCDRSLETAKDSYFALCSKGAAVTAGVTYPAKDSRSDIACRKVLEISKDCFIQRPSLKDIAIDTISTFINEGIYIFQEPDRAFLCNTALLYVLNGKARWVTAGNAVICHYVDGHLAKMADLHRSPLFGERIRWREKAAPEFDISHGVSSFVLCSAADDFDLTAALPEYISPSDLRPDIWAAAALSLFSGISCSAAAIVLPGKSFFREHPKGAS